jgi:uncharacterized protein YecE (DUF72 family)
MVIWYGKTRMQPDAIEIGTSGWKFEDWAGTFYPLRVPKTKWLEYYAARFPIGEINSTYYRIAPPSAYKAISERTPPEFRLFSKVHGDVTHTRTKPQESMKYLMVSLDSLRESGKLLGLLAQFPGAFHYNSDSVDYLAGLIGPCEGVRLCTEFRHRSWTQQEAIETIRKLGITWVSVDEPDLPDLLPAKLISTSDIFYLRMHGRNAAAWYDRSLGDRYNYQYSEQELAATGGQLLAAEMPAQHGYVLFNNCHLGQAPTNALWLKTWLAAVQADR